MPLFQNESKYETIPISYENEFCMKFYFQANQSHFHNGFALRLALKQRHKETLMELGNEADTIVQKLKA